MVIEIHKNPRRKQLLRDGYCIFDGVLDQEMLVKMREVTERLLLEQTAEDAAKNRSPGSMINVKADSAFAELIAWPPALEALTSLGYPCPKFTSGYVISKPAHSPRLFWHHDYACWSDPDCFGEVPQQLFLMYYLVDTYPDNGCLRVIPGSHVHDNPLHTLLEEAHSDELKAAKNSKSAAFMDCPDEVDVLVKAGDLLIGDSRLLHASHANNSDHRRTVITLWFHPDMSALAGPVQGYIAQMTMNVPPDWPEEEKARIEPLLARYTGSDEPLHWNRSRPQRGK